MGNGTNQSNGWTKLHFEVRPREAQLWIGNKENHAQLKREGIDWFLLRYFSTVAMQDLLLRVTPDCAVGGTD